MPSKFERPAKLIVTALCRGPGVAAEQIGHMAVERVAGWFGPEERSRYEGLVRQVEGRLSKLPAHEIGGAERLEQALTTAEAHLWEAGLTIDDLIRRNLDAQAAVAEQQARFDRWPPGQGADVGPICRQHVIPAVFEALFADEGALAEIDLAFKQAVLAKLDVIEREGDVAGTLMAMAAEAMLVRPRVMPWIADRHAPSALLVPERGIVGFAGRRQLEQEMLAWCEAPADIGVQLLFGPGGMGKTRFAHELCRRADARGWRAGFLQRHLAEVPGWLATQLNALPEVRHRRTLAAARPDAFTPDLAGALINLANLLSDLDRREDALAAAEEARDHHRALAAARPDAFTPDLAMALNSLANRLSDLGRREDALADALEARDLFRALTAARPDAFTPDLAVSLAVLANCLEAVERASDAVAANREAIAALRAPFLTHSAAFAHRMVPMRQQYIERCERLGREPDAELLGPIVEALQRIRQG